MQKSGGEILVEALKVQGVDRVFCVPGESYLDVLNALYDSGIRTINARHEGGAAIMAEAQGKITGRPGIAMVTRGPGATNAACGIHIAKQDSTPMILFVGQIGRNMRGREAFQEVDYRQTFRDLAKWVDEIDDASRIPEVIAHAYHVAMSGRPGPVVLALPEDMLLERVEATPAPKIEVACPAPSAADMAKFEALFATSKKPFLVLGGSRWKAEDVQKVERLAERCNIPVGCSFRRQHLFNHTHSNYAGDVGLGINPELKLRLMESDLLILLGARFSENPSQNFSVLGIPTPGKNVVHIHPGPEELGRIYTTALSINATVGNFLDALEGLKTMNGKGEVKNAHSSYRAWTDEVSIPKREGYASTGAVIKYLRETLPEDVIVTNGAGNYAIWLHRYFRFRGFGTQIAPTSGSMGYGLPAAIAAKLHLPERTVVCLAGDGCFQMTSQELATAVQEKANIVTIVLDNSLYGTIRMHQEKNYPDRVSATRLINPDFAAVARACGAYGETVTSDEDFEGAFSRALQADLPALLHVKTDPAIITPTMMLATDA